MGSIRLEIPELFISCLTEVTQQVTGFPMEGSVKQSRVQDDVRCVNIKSEGVFRSVMSFQMEQSLVEAILRGMNLKESASAELRRMYLGEYVNILSGHAITRINNMTGKFSRLTVPEIKNIKEYETYPFQNTCIVYFTSNYGNMKLEMNFEMDC